MGLVTSSAGGSETRPACHDAGLPGAGCPGSACRRYHEARDRTEPEAERPPARTAVERRKASASAKGGARRDQAQTQAALRLCATAVSKYAPFGAPPPLGEARFVTLLAKLGARTKSAARER